VLCCAVLCCAVLCRVVVPRLLQSAAEVRLHSKDFVDPTLVFEDTSEFDGSKATEQTDGQQQQAASAQPAPCGSLLFRT